MVLKLPGNIGDYAEIPDHNDFSLNRSTGLTISVWIRPDVLDFPNTQSSGDGPFVNFLDKIEYGPGCEWQLIMYNKTNSQRPNRISCYLYNPSCGEGAGSYFQYPINDSNPIVKGEWINIIARYDDTNTYISKNGIAKRCDRYISGSGTGGCVDPYVVVNPQNTSSTVKIGTGALNTSSPNYFLGAAKDITFYDRFLSDAECLNLYQGNKPTSGIIAEYKCDQPSTDTILIDSSGRNHNGTLHGNAHFESETPTTQLETIQISPSSASIVVGKSIQFTSTCKDGSGNMISCPALIWVCSNTSVATIGPTGLVTGKSVGSANITALSGQILSNISTIIIIPSLGSIRISLPIKVGLSQQLFVKCKDTNGNNLICPTLSWSSSNISVATVNSTGLVTGKSVGTVNITASASGIKSNIFIVTVTM